MPHHPGPVDLDRTHKPNAENSLEAVAECSCGTKRSLLRYFAVRPCASRALARLKAAHPDEYAQYLTELKDEALADFDTLWRQHLAGDHTRRYR